MIRRLLVVDDDTVFANMLVRSLTRLGHRATTADTPDAACRALREQSFDAAIVDLRLGERSGLALIEPLLAIDPCLRILMLTGYASIATAIDAVKRGAFNYLPKPATTRQILAALDDRPDAGDGVHHEARPSLRRLEWEHMQRVLLDHGYNVSAAARTLGMHRRTLQRKLAKKPVRE